MTKKEKALFKALCKFEEDTFDTDLLAYASPEVLGHVKTQLSWFFRFIPRAIKCTVMRLAYRYFGESNSCITLTNLGNVVLPEAMAPYVKNIEVILTPRAGSPYNCAILSYGGVMRFNLSRFCKEPELDEIFFRKLDQAIR